MNPVLLQLISLFAGLSMLAFGGGTAVIPAMQRSAVGHYHWLTADEFLDMFAISRAAPGPGSLIVLKAAGFAGAAVSFCRDVRALLPRSARARPLLAPRRRST
jgi:chromate transporter